MAAWHDFCGAVRRYTVLGLACVSGSVTLDILDLNWGSLGYKFLVNILNNEG